jgi:hypothetical protein
VRIEREGENDRQPTVHVKLAEAEPRVSEEVERGAPVVQLHSHVGAAAWAVRLARAVGLDESKASDREDLVDETANQRHAKRLHSL